MRKSSNISKFFSKDKADTPSKHAYWPRDLLPKTVPFSRILTFGYDTTIRHSLIGPESCHNTVRDIANDLLNLLEAERRCEPERPLLFIVHSLGGIVLKEMLFQSRLMSASRSKTEMQGSLLKVSAAIRAIIFFGTPHNGSDPRKFLQSFLVGIFRAAGFKANDSIVNAILPTSERIKEYRTVFSEMAQEGAWNIYSFQESYGIMVLEDRKVRRCSMHSENHVADNRIGCRR